MWISYSMVGMTDFVEDDMMRYYMGYVNIALFGTIVLGDLSYISNIIYKTLAQNYRMAKNKEACIK
jgi:hypothetical protein